MKKDNNIKSKEHVKKYTEKFHDKEKLEGWRELSTKELDAQVKKMNQDITSKPKRWYKKLSTNTKIGLLMAGVGTGMVTTTSIPIAIAIGQVNDANKRTDTSLHEQSKLNKKVKNLTQKTKTIQNKTNQDTKTIQTMVSQLEEQESQQKSLNIDLKATKAQKAKVEKISKFFKDRSENQRQNQQIDIQKRNDRIKDEILWRTIYKNRITKLQLQKDQLKKDSKRLQKELDKRHKNTQATNAHTSHQIRLATLQKHKLAKLNKEVLYIYKLALNKADKNIMSKTWLAERKLREEN